MEIRDGPIAGFTETFPGEPFPRNGLRKGVPVQECTHVSESVECNEEAQRNVRTTFEGTVLGKTTG